MTGELKFDEDAAEEAERLLPLSETTLRRC